MLRIVIVISFLFSFSSLRAQGQLDQSSFSTIGVARYAHPEETRYRGIFGFGGNAGLGASTPQSFIVDISYEMAPSLLTAGIIGSNSVSFQPPRLTYTEFDLMYGIALDRVFPHYAGPSDEYHAALSAGISFSSYQTRWHNFRRGQQFDTLFLSGPPNSFQYSFGIPIQLQAIYEPLRYAGIGILLFYTISNFQPSYGGAIVIEARY